MVITTTQSASIFFVNDKKLIQYAENYKKEFALKNEMYIDFLYHNDFVQCIIACTSSSTSSVMDDTFEDMYYEFYSSLIDMGFQIIDNG